MKTDEMPSTDPRFDAVWRAEHPAAVQMTNGESGDIVTLWRQNGWPENADPTEFVSATLAQAERDGADLTADFCAMVLAAIEADERG